MKEQLINLQTANIAKNKGFEIRTDFRYDRNNEIATTPSLKYRIKNNQELLIKPSEFIFAPTQSLLQKWLRDVHDIHICIWRNQLTKTYRIDTINDEYFEDDTHYKTYEEALEVGLQEALKLI